MRIHADRTRCIGSGVCESLASAVFEVDDEGEVVLKTERVPGGLLADVEAAVAGCPAGALGLGD